MDCPDCGGPLGSYVLDGREASICERCGWVGIEADHRGEGAPTESWDDALDRFYERHVTTERRRSDLPPVAAATDDLADAEAGDDGTESETAPRHAVEAAETPTDVEDVGAGTETAAPDDGATNGEVADLIDEAETPVASQSVDDGDDPADPAERATGEAREQEQEQDEEQEQDPADEADSRDDPDGDAA